MPLPTLGRRATRRSAAASDAAIKHEQDEDKPSATTPRRPLKKKKAAEDIQGEQPSTSKANIQMSPPPPDALLASPTARVSARLAVKLKTMKKEGREMPWHSLMTNRKRSHSQSDSESSDSAEERKRRRPSQPSSVSPRASPGATPKQISVKKPATMARGSGLNKTQKVQTSPPEKSPTMPSNKAGTASKVTQSSPRSRQTRSVSSDVQNVAESAPAPQGGSPSYKTSPTATSKSRLEESAVNVASPKTGSSGQESAQTAGPGISRVKAAFRNTKVLQNAAITREIPSPGTPKTPASLEKEVKKESPVESTQLVTSPGRKLAVVTGKSPRPSVQLSRGHEPGKRTSSSHQPASADESVSSAADEEMLPKRPVGLLDDSAHKSLTITKSVLPAGASIKHVPSRVINLNELSPQLKSQLGISSGTIHLPVTAQGSSGVRHVSPSVVQQKTDVKLVPKLSASVLVPQSLLSSSPKTCSASSTSSTPLAATASRPSESPSGKISVTPSSKSSLVTATSSSTVQTGLTTSKGRPLARTVPASTPSPKRSHVACTSVTGGSGDARFDPIQDPSGAVSNPVKRGLLAAAAAVSPNIKKPANRTYYGVAAAVSQDLLARVTHEESRSILRIVAAKADVKVAYAKEMAFLIGDWQALELAKATLEKEIELCVKENLKAKKAAAVLKQSSSPKAVPLQVHSSAVILLESTDDADATNVETVLEVDMPAAVPEVEKADVGVRSAVVRDTETVSEDKTVSKTPSLDASTDPTKPATASYRSLVIDDREDETVMEFDVNVQKMSLDEQEEEQEQEEEDHHDNAVDIRDLLEQTDPQSPIEVEASADRGKQLHGGCIAVRNPELATAVCDLCGFATTVMGLYKHKLRNHSKMRFECEVCLKQFGLKYDMRRHRLIHFTPAGDMTADGLAILQTHSPKAESFHLQTLEPDYVEHSHIILERSEDSESQNDSETLHQNGAIDGNKTGKQAGNIIDGEKQVTVSGTMTADASGEDNIQGVNKDVDGSVPSETDGNKSPNNEEKSPAENGAQTELDNDSEVYLVKKEVIDGENENPVKTGNLKVPRQTHTDLKPFVCNITGCDKAFKTHERLKTHKLAHMEPPEDPIKRPGRSLSLTSPSRACCICVRCGFKSSAHGIMKHEQRHHPAYTYPCSYCDQQFGITTDLRLHIEKQHPEQNVPTLADMKKRVHCQSCTFISTARIVQQHIKMMHVMTRIDCLYCKEVCTTVADMKAHYNQIHPEIFVGNIGLKVLPRDNESFTCNICCKMMKMSRYQSHMLAHEQQRYNCDQCDFVARWPWQVRKHRDIQHNNVRPMCSLCGKTFTQESSYRFHMRTKHPADPEANIIRCEQCGKEFTSKRFLNVHIKRIHSKEMRHFCNMCGKGFFEKIRMKEHRDTHFAEGDKEIPKRFECRWCHHKFIKQSQLTQHENIHTGNKPYKCKICGRGFSWASEVHKHMFTHSDERPYVCNQCGRGFKFRYKLKTHMITHTHNSQHVCQACGKAFTMMSTLRRHRCKTVNVDPNRHGLQTEFYISVEQAETMLEDEQQQQVMLLEQQEEVHEAVPEPLLEVNQNEAEVGSSQVVSYMCGVCQNLYNSVEEVNEHITVEHGMTVVMEDNTAVKSEMEGETNDAAESPTQQMVVEETGVNELVLQSLPASEINGIQQIVISEDGEQVIMPSGDDGEHHQLILGDGEQLEVIEMEEADMDDAQIVDADNITYITSSQVEQIVTDAAEVTDEEQAIANALTSLAS